MRLGLVLHPARDCRPAIDAIVDRMREHAVEVVVAAEHAGRVPDAVRGIPVDELRTTCDGLIAIGGDGTVLGALRGVADRPVPVLAVNLGNVGFLAEVAPEDLPAALDRLLAGDYSLEPRACLRVRWDEHEEVAFNDLSLVRTPGHGPVEAELTIAGHRHGVFRSDAVVIATPMGSTAYSYAAGGPIVSPGVDGLLVTPASPMSGISRPLVLSFAEPLRLAVGERGRPTLELDGAAQEQLETGDAVDVRVQPDAGRLVRFDAPGYRSRSQVKLSLLDLPLLPEELRELLPPRARRSTPPPDPA